MPGMTRGARRAGAPGGDRPQPRRHRLILVLCLLAVLLMVIRPFLH